MQNMIWREVNRMQHVNSMTHDNEWCSCHRILCQNAIILGAAIGIHKVSLDQEVILIQLCREQEISSLIQMGP
jgi:hypothetical protein